MKFSARVWTGDTVLKQKPPSSSTPLIPIFSSQVDVESEYFLPPPLPPPWTKNPSSPAWITAVISYPFSYSLLLEATSNPIKSELNYVPPLLNPPLNPISPVVNAKILTVAPKVPEIHDPIFCCPSLLLQSGWCLLLLGTSRHPLALGISNCSLLCPERFPPATLVAHPWSSLKCHMLSEASAGTVSRLALPRQGLLPLFFVLFVCV